jgi:hypothetical protein
MDQLKIILDFARRNNYISTKNHPEKIYLDPNQWPQDIHYDSAISTDANIDEILGLKCLVHIERLAISIFLKYENQWNLISLHRLLDDDD